MLDKIREHIAKVEAFRTEKKEELEQFRVEYFGKKGVLNDLFSHFKSVANEEKKSFGQIINELKQKLKYKNFVTHSKTHQTIQAFIMTLHAQQSLSL